jgi:hypothetical protein
MSAMHHDSSHDLKILGAKLKDIVGVLLVCANLVITKI